MPHVLKLLDLDAEQIREIFARSRELKASFFQGRRDPLLAGRLLALIFEKPSLRTRVSFAAAMAQLGGASQFFGGKEVGLGHRESVSDFARILGDYVDAVVLRTFSQELQEEIARHCPCPVINGLSDQFHPCQALADLFTLAELWETLEGRTLTFVGDGNNVARSLAVCCGKLGVRFVLAAPEVYHFPSEFVAQLEQQLPELDWEQLEDPHEAVRDADVIYTDVWASMGQEAEAEQRRKDFAPFQVNAALLATAPSARFMHCLPAHRGEEVTDEVMDGPASVVFHQAENRMHLQKGLLVWLLGQ
jgi:ornithine carbamoyltransferase